MNSINVKDFLKKLYVLFLIFMTTDKEDCREFYDSFKEFQNTSKKGDTKTFNLIVVNEGRDNHE